MLCLLCYGENPEVNFHNDHVCCKYCFNAKFECDPSYPVECFKCCKFLNDNECLKFLNKPNQIIYRRNKNYLSDILDKFLFKCFDENCNGEYRHEESFKLKKFVCPKCKKRNCLKCRAIHKEKENCQMWKENHEEIVLERNEKKAENDKKIKAKNGMYCVKCGTFWERDGGCYGVKCAVCKTSLCFVTQKARWGPEGIGDISDGCQCTDDRRCHKKCRGCTPDYPNNNSDDDDDDDYDYDDDDDDDEYYDCNDFFSFYDSDDSDY